MTFSNALAAAHHAGNTYLQFQACEGLGSIQLQWGRHGEAIGHFEQALGLLDEIKEDSGIARERITEKLSDALEFLEQTKEAIKEKAEEEDIVSEGETLEPSDSEMELGAVERDEDKEEGVGNLRAKRVTRSLTPEFNVAALYPSSGKKPPRVPVPSPKQVEKNRKELSLQERRGVGGKLPSLHTGHKGRKSPLPPPSSLPPLHTRKSPLLSSSAEQIPARNLSRRGKEKLRQDRSNRDSDSTCSFNEQLATYIDSYRDSSLDDDADNSNFETFLGGSSPVPVPSQDPVKEGSLAIGAKARENFKVQTVEESTGKGRRRHRQKSRSEIVPTSASIGAQSSSSEQRVGDRETNMRTNTQERSKICTIL